MTPPIRQHILMTADAVGGVWVYATDLARALCDAGNSVTLAVMGPPPDRDQLAGLKEVRGLRIVVTDLALEWQDPEGADAPRARDTLLRLADRARPDIIHLNGYREATFGWAHPVLVVAHSCVWSWWLACHGCRPHEPRWHIYRQAVASGLAAADAWAAPSAAFRAEVEAIYAPPTAGHVIWNGAHIESVASRRESEILAAGRFWDRAKNISVLAEIGSLDWPLCIAGPLQDASETVEAASNLTWLGPLSRPALLARMRRAGVFVSPAVYEPFGLTVMEAAACGCALVLSDIASFRELWDDAALFVDGRDPGAFRHALQRVCADRELRRALQHAAARRARRYSLARMVKAYLEVYRRMGPFRPCRSASSAQQTVGAPA